MAEIFPFAAYRYDTRKYRLEDVLTQPYDKITPAMQEACYARHPENLIVLEKGRSTPQDTPDNNVYTRAAAALRGWVTRQVLVRDAGPAIYVYVQDYRVPGSAERAVRKGFIALGRVVDYDAGIVHRHEQTLAGPRADRLELLRHTRAHTGQLFMLYADPARAIDALLEEAARGPALAEMRDEYDVLHRLWAIRDPARIAEVQQVMRDHKLVIADGHHRYETALAYRNAQRAATGHCAPDAPHERVMMTFFNTHSEGLLILPTHRVVAGLAQFDLAAFRRQMAAWFEVEEFSSTGPDRVAQYRAQLTARGRRARVLGVYAGGTFWFFALRGEAHVDALLAHVPAAQRQLDVVLLHRLVLEKGLGISADAVSKERHLTYEREMEDAVAAVDSGRAALAFLVNPVSVEQTVSMALAGEVLPQKSTDFYPKLLSGMTIYRLDA
jgi:uncharacterized protein (DUF1015 family)